MKHLILALTLISFLLIGCGDTKVIDGIEYGTVGLFTKDKMPDNIQYEVIVGNVVWSCILVQTIFAPVYFVGFSIWEPVGAKQQ